MTIGNVENLATCPATTLKKIIGENNKEIYHIPYKRTVCIDRNVCALI